MAAKAKSTKAPAEKAPAGKARYVIVRGQSSGCFAGELVSRAGREVVLAGCRRLWKWEGAASLSELAARGTSKPSGCMFPRPTTRHEILDAIEVIEVSPEARRSIEGVAEWTR